MSFAVVMEGTVDDVDTDATAALLADQLGVDAEQVSLTVEAASVKVTVSVTYTDAAAAAGSLAATSSLLSDASSFASTFGKALLSVETSPGVAQVIVNAPSPPPPSPPPIPRPFDYARIAMGSGSPGFPVGRTMPLSAPPWRHDEPATWQYRRNFSFFVTDAAGEAGSVQALLQGHAYSPASSFVIKAQPVSSVLPVLRTALLYADRSELRAAFLLRDADGRSLVSSNGLSIQMVATGPL